MNRTLLLASLGTLFVASLALAHDDVSPRVSSGRIVTDGIDDASSTITPGLRVFGYDFGEADPVNDPYFTEDPGFHALSSSGFPAGSAVRFASVDPLKFWNGENAVIFAGVPSLESIRLNLGSFDLTIRGVSGPLNGFDIATVEPDGSFHEHLSAFLLGADGNSDPFDGNNPADGVYLLSLRLISGDTGIAGSEPFYVVYNNGMDESVHDAAIEAVSASIPAPGAVPLGGLLLAGLAIRRPKRCREKMVQAPVPQR